MAHEIARFPQACMRRACEGWVSNPGAAGSRFCQRRPRDIAILGKSDAQELNSWSLADSHSRGPEVKCMAARPDAHDLFHLLGGIDQELHVGVPVKASSDPRAFPSSHSDCIPSRAKAHRECVS